MALGSPLVGTASACKSPPFTSQLQFVSPFVSLVYWARSAAGWKPKRRHSIHYAPWTMFFQRIPTNPQRPYFDRFSARLSGRLTDYLQFKLLYSCFIYHGRGCCLPSVKRRKEGHDLFFSHFLGCASAKLWMDPLIRDIEGNVLLDIKETA